jgi:hypothetical protein
MLLALCRHLSDELSNMLRMTLAHDQDMAARSSYHEITNAEQCHPLSLSLRTWQFSHCTVANGRFRA